jgi:hypothetical protein
VKQFASQMITDHTQANEELMQLAQSKGVTLPKAPMRAEQRAQESLKKYPMRNSTGNMPRSKSRTIRRQWRFSGKRQNRVRMRSSKPLLRNTCLSCSSTCKWLNRWRLKAKQHDIPGGQSGTDSNLVQSLSGLPPGVHSQTLMQVRGATSFFPKRMPPCSQRKRMALLPGSAGAGR